MFSLALVWFPLQLYALGFRILKSNVRWQVKSQRLVNNEVYVAVIWQKKNNWNGDQNYFNKFLRNFPISIRLFFTQPRLSEENKILLFGHKKTLISPKTLAEF